MTHEPQPWADGFRFDPNLSHPIQEPDDPFMSSSPPCSFDGHAVDAQLRACSLNASCARVNLGSSYPCLGFTDVGIQPDARPL